MALQSRSFRPLSRLLPASRLRASQAPRSSSISTSPSPTSTPARKPSRTHALPSRARIANPSSPHRHAYHSATHPLPASAYGPEQTALLSAALAHVPAHGFSDTALRLGARDAGFVDAATQLLPKGVFDLVLYHYATRRAALAGGVQFPEASGSGSVDERVRALVWARLRANEEVKVLGKLQEALAVMAQPTNVPASLAELASLADEICHLAGDANVDARWYSKRAALSAVYAASEVFMTQDASPGYRDTERFMDSRLEEVRMGGDFLAGVGKWAGFTGQSFVNVLRSKGVGI